ncbi:YtxH domain-containing protein [Mucilaginibacter sp. dw_454]|uniref:YtxH domain-containing protein n=1 Tax=Mucilaginibacter sp. dw_454 TaxID=2720079 RepID=UPI001BD20A05|nr:YtxH domain-containing protein [Mucilaginibacter sp. dw_454]
MKNPFERKNNTALIALGVTGAAAAGAIAYLYLTDSGHNTRNKISDSLADTIDKISHGLKDEFKNIVSGFISDKTNISKKTVKAVADHVSK